MHCSILNFRGRLPTTPCQILRWSCGACHDSHIPGPNGKQLAAVNGVVQVTSLSGSTVTGVTPIQRKAPYLNHKPYKLAENGSQDVLNGIWTRGSAITRPNLSIVSGVGTLSPSGDSYILTFPGGGFLGRINPLTPSSFPGQPPERRISPTMPSMQERL